MKKTIQILGLALLSCFSVAAQDRMAAQSMDFMAGNQVIWLTNGGGATYNLVNVGFSNAQGLAVWSLTNQFTTNVLTAGPTGSFTNGNVYYGAAWYDVPSFSDVNGKNADAAIAVSFHGASTNSTNLVSFTFVPLLKRVGNVLSAPSTTNAQFSFTTSSSGTGQSTMVTNIPAAMMQGAMGWRCTLATNVATTGAQGIFIDQMTLNGFH